MSDSDSSSSDSDSDSDSDEDDKDKEAKVSVVSDAKHGVNSEIRCDICISGRVIKNLKRLRVPEFGINACSTHDLSTLREAVQNVSLKAQLNPECKGGHCRCSNLRTTCNGQWNRASIVAKAREVAAYAASKEGRQAKKLKRDTQKLKGKRPARRGSASSANSKKK